MTALCFVDANIFVYAINPTEPLKKEVALALIDGLWRQQRACTSVQAINEFYVVVARKLRQVVALQEAWAQVQDLLEWKPLPVDSRLVLQAKAIEARYKLSWWDCLIVAAARLQHCTVLYTEDLQHGAILDGVKVVNPFVAQVQEEPAHYAGQVISPHRPRGRPRKQPAAA